MVKAGDKVTWNTPQGETQGTVEGKVIRPTRVKGHVAKPTPTEPQFVVRSAKSGKTAVHKPEQLKPA